MTITAVELNIESKHKHYTLVEQSKDWKPQSTAAMNKIHPPDTHSSATKEYKS